MAGMRKIFAVSDSDSVKYRGKKGEAHKLAKEMKSDLVELGGYAKSDAAELVSVREVDFEMTADAIAGLVEQEVEKAAGS